MNERVSTLKELEQAAWRVQDSGNDRDPEIARWLGLLISPGSSLGGARPKASVLDEEQNLWIAKFLNLRGLKTMNEEIIKRHIGTVQFGLLALIFALPWVYGGIHNS